MKLVRRYFSIGLIIGVYTLFRLWYSDFVPFWDGWGYYEHECILRASQYPNIFWNFDCYNHVNIAVTMIYAAFQQIHIGNLFLFHLPSILIGVISIWFFYKLLQLVFDKDIYAREIELLTILFAGYPILFVNSLNINLDYHIVSFFIPLLYFTFTRNRWGIVIVGTLLVFTKEPGIGLYCMAIGLRSLFDFSHCTFSLKKFFHMYWKDFILSLPVILFIIRLVLKILVYKQDAFWYGMNPLSGAMKDQTMPDPSVYSKIFSSYLILIFIVHFNWILSVFSFSGGIVYVWKRIMGTVRLPRIHAERVLFLVVIFFPMVLFLTWYKTYSNVRYFLPLYPMLMIFCWISLCFLIQNIRVRRGILTTIVVIFLIGNIRSFDPVTSSIFSTFQFGTHQLYYIASYTGECCGYGRDQLAYNLEYLNYHYLLSDILADIHPTKQTYIAYGPTLGPHFIGWTDTITGKRTMSIEHSLKDFPHYIMWNYDTLTEQEKPSILYFLDFPTTDSKAELQWFTQYYSVVSTKEYDRAGYQATVYILKKKNI